MEPSGATLCGGVGSETRDLQCEIQEDLNQVFLAAQLRSLGRGW
jgi:hypothetical protein